jgi:tetratricopeptide (TPR) repeat protein
MESSLWDTALMITRLSSTKCSERLKRAMDMFSAGDNKGAQAVLNEEEIERDVEHNLHLIQLGEEGRKGLKINIEEYRLKIKTLENEMTEGWLSEVCKLNERIIELTSSLYGDNSLEEAQAIMDATESIYLLEDFEKLYQYTQKALNIRVGLLGEMHLDTAQCYNDLGVVSGKLGNLKSYLEYAKKGLEIRENLGAPDALLSESYNTVGLLTVISKSMKSILNTN